MTTSLNDAPYYQQVHQALYGQPCPRVRMSHGIDEDEFGLSVQPNLILSLAGKEELEQALTRRVGSFESNFEFESKMYYGVEFGLNRAIQKGIVLKSDQSDGMYYIYHESGCIVKIPTREVKKRVIPPPGLFDSFQKQYIHDDKAPNAIHAVSALWNSRRVFPRGDDMLYKNFFLCKTEQPIYEGHDHICWINWTELEN